MAFGLPFKRWVNVNPSIGTIELDQTSRPQAVQDWQTTLCMQVFGQFPPDITDTTPTATAAQEWFDFELVYEPSYDAGFDFRLFGLNRNQTFTADDGTGFKLLNHTGSYFDCYHPANLGRVFENDDLPNAVAPYNCFDSITRRNFLVFVDQRNKWVRDGDGNYQDKLTVIEYQLVYDTETASWPIIDGNTSRDILELGRWEIPIELPTAMSDHLQANTGTKGGAFSRFRSHRAEDDAAVAGQAVALDKRYLVVQDICVLNGIFYLFFSQNQIIAFTLEDGFIQESYAVLRMIHGNPNATTLFRTRKWFMDTEKIMDYQSLAGYMGLWLWPSVNPDFSDPTLLKQVVERNVSFTGRGPQTADNTLLALARAQADNVNGAGLPVLVFPEMTGTKISRIFFMYCTRAPVNDPNGKKYPSNLNRWVLYSWGFRRAPVGLANRNYPRLGEVQFTDMEGPELVYGPVDSQSNIQQISNVAPWNSYLYNVNLTPFSQPPYTFNYHTGPSFKGTPYFGGPYYHRASRINIPFRVRLVEEDVTLDRQIREEVTTSGADVSRTAVSIRGEYSAVADMQVFNVEDALSVPIEGSEDISFFYGGYKYAIQSAKRTSRVRWRVKLKVTVA